ncbi:MAG: hypothetical protein HC915_18910 [Anaerolineae bacterium]|nr:hypothetical protein [Anaerolineae bacterium]
MTSVSLNQFLILYLWFPLAALLMLMLLIARFYENVSGRRTYYRLFLLVIVLFGGAMVRYASVDGIIGDVAGDALLGLAGVVLAGISLHLLRLMVLSLPWETGRGPQPGNPPGGSAVDE